MQTLKGNRERFIEEKNKKRQRKKMIANNMLILSRSYGLQCFATILDSWPLNVYLSIRFRGALFAGFATISWIHK